MLLTPDGVPQCLMRAFTEEAHLQSFLAGDVLVRRAEAFRATEDLARRDKTEGEARLIVPGKGGVDVHYGGSFHDPAYLLCCSECDAKTANLGPWRATIKAPEALLSALSIAAAACVPGREVMVAALLRVRYTKATKSPETPPSQERDWLMHAQKPQEFAVEREWRYVLVVSGGVPDSPTELRLRIEGMAAYACARLAA